MLPSGLLREIWFKHAAIIVWCDEDPDGVREAYGDSVYDRLVDVKTKYDPDNVFHHDQNIRLAPARASAGPLGLVLINAQMSGGRRGIRCERSPGGMSGGDARTQPRGALSE